MPRAFRHAACLALLLACAGGAARAAETEVDLALVLAVDVSFSMDTDEQELQRQGFTEAFRSPAVLEAIRRGLVGRIAVTYMEWAGAGDQRVVVPWTTIDGPDSAAAFADQLAAKPTRRASRTSISGALGFALGLLEQSGYEATRRVIDVSGDGPNNHGRPVEEARADVLGRGITINGLPVMLKAPGYFDIAELDLYYRDCVIGGPGAFLVPARDRAQFVEAIKTKIIMEVASRPDPVRAAGAGTALPILRTAAGPEGRRANCMAGEAQWRDRMGTDR
jgi:hypothetical protein